MQRLAVAGAPFGVPGATRHSILGGLVLAVVAGCGGGSNAGDSGTRGESSNSGGTGGTAGSGGNGISGSGQVTAGASNAAGTTATGGTASGGNSTGGSAGGAGSAVLDEFNACVHYLRTACHKHYSECGTDFGEEDCLASVEVTCPDRYFSEGSNITVASLLACAEEWERASCADVNAGLVPNCLTPGDFTQGQPCTFASQCQSTQCSAVFSIETGCGQCQTLVGAGETCTDPLVACDAGLYCDGATCVATPPVTAPHVPPGGACTGNIECIEPHYCSSASSTCVPYPRVGEMCVPEAGQCEGWCDVDNACRALPGVGEPCPSPPTGPGRCASGSRCDTTASAGPTCVTLDGPGESCTTSVNFWTGSCAGGFACHCADAACATSSCVMRRGAGESCTTATDVCTPGTRCEAGTCAVIPGGQGLFAASCDP